MPDESIDITQAITNAELRITSRGDLPHVSVEHQLAYLRALAGSALGRSLIQSQTFSALWTDYVMVAPPQSETTMHNISDDLEHFILHRSPLICGWREVFYTFRNLMKDSLRDDIVLGSIPCGAMRDVLSLDFSKLSNFALIGVDVDESVLSVARGISDEVGLSRFVQFLREDAWELSLRRTVDVVASCGLNIYESHPNRRLSLYERLYQALRPGGKVILSYLTYPPWINSKSSEWKLEGIAKADLDLERILYDDILDLKCLNFQYSSEVKFELEAVGFEDVEIRYDKHGVFPVAVAYASPQCTKTG